MFTCTTTAPLAPSASISYQLTLTLDPDYPAPTLVNTASITSSPISDPVPGNDSATDTDTVTTSADLAITKTDGVASVVAGTSTTYAITVTNNGPSTVPAGVVISDPIPANPRLGARGQLRDRRRGVHLHHDRGPAPSASVSTS